MGLNLNNADVVGAAVAAAMGTNGKPLKPAAKIWLNPGIFITFAGEEESTFVGLSQGLPLDTMDPAKTNYSSPKMRALGQAKNALRDKIMALSEGKAPGDTFMINVQCQVRLVSEDQPAAPADVDAVTAALDALIIA